MSLKPIREFLRDTIGLDHETVGTSIIDSAITRHMKGLDIDDVDAYLSALKSSPAKAKKLIGLVEVNETWFFRQPAAFRCLKSIVGRKLKQLSTANRLRVLSLGCATGEEPYSIAMLLRDMNIAPELFIIDAVDISEKAIEAAKEAQYGETSFDTKSDLSYRTDHFTKVDRDYRLRSNITGCVNFIHGNILHHTCPLTSPMYDIIFCRHVIIYLCDAARQALLKRLDALLAEDGAVFVGECEANILRNCSYSTCKPPAAFAFQKRSADAPEQKERPGEPTPRRSRPRQCQPAVVAAAQDRHLPVEPEKTEDSAVPEYCWLTCGISGDRSCQKLRQYIRCYNCPTRIEHGRHFLDRASPEEYLDDWKNRLARKELPKNSSAREHTVVFRIGSELFGLPSRLIKDVSSMADIHRIPYRSNNVLLGMANCSGELRLCVSLAALLPRAAGQSPSCDHMQTRNVRIYKRMLTLEAEGQTWSFPVDEIVDIRNISESDVTPRSKQDCTDAIYSRGTSAVQGRPVLLLDHTLLLEGIRRSIQ